MMLLNKVYLRKARHACRTNKKGQILVNLGQFEAETFQTGCKLKVFGV